MIRINLLPVRAEKRKENVRKHALLIVAYVAVIGALVGSVHMTMGSRVDAKKQRIAHQKREIAQLDAKIKEVQDYNKRIEALADKIRIIAGLELQQKGPARVFHELALQVPKQLWIERINENNGRLSMDGFAIDRQTIAAFMMKLDKSTVFSGIKLKISKKKEKSGVELQEFTLEASVVSPKISEPAPKTGKAG